MIEIDLAEMQIQWQCKGWVVASLPRGSHTCPAESHPTDERGIKEVIQIHLTPMSSNDRQREAVERISYPHKGLNITSGKEQVLDIVITSLLAFAYFGLKRKSGAKRM